MKTIIGTMSPGIGVTASAVRKTPCTTHGCRPTSVTVHPASVAMNPNGATIASARSSSRWSSDRRLRTHDDAAHALTSAIAVPSADHDLKAEMDRRDRRPHARARTPSVPSPRRRDRETRAATVRAESRSRIAFVAPPSSGQPPMRSGAPRSVSNCPSSAASLIGCHCATVRALKSPDSGWSIAAGAPMRSASVSARR